MSEKDCNRTVLEQWQIEKTNLSKRLQQGEEEIIHLKQENDMEIQKLVETHAAQIDQLNVSLQVFYLVHSFQLKIIDTPNIF